MSGKRICSVEHCDGPVSARGMCRKHYRRDARRRAALQRPPKPTTEERFWSRVRKTDGCWLWTGCVASWGYGVLNLGVHSQSAHAHRYAYELLVGPIPDGLQIDHLCHNADPTCPGNDGCAHRRCVNPAHMEPVTQAENNRRAMAARGWKRRRTPIAPELVRS